MSQVGNLERCEIDQDYDEYDHAAVLEQYVDCYTELQATSGWF